MRDALILQPLLALSLWTFLVLALIPIARVRAGRRGQIVSDDFKYGESARVPPSVSIPNRNYMNLLELPVLFYALCLVLYVTHGVGSTVLTLAWIYVALRVVHSLIHLSYNHVIHRLAAFATSNGVLIALWVWTAMHVAALPG